MSKLLKWILPADEFEESILPERTSKEDNVQSHDAGV